MGVHLHCISFIQYWDVLCSYHKHLLVAQKRSPFYEHIFSCYKCLRCPLHLVYCHPSNWSGDHGTGFRDRFSQWANILSYTMSYSSVLYHPMSYSCHNDCHSNKHGPSPLVQPISLTFPFDLLLDPRPKKFLSNGSVPGMT